MPDIPRHQTVARIVRDLKRKPPTADCITATFEIDAIDARTELFPDHVPKKLREALGGVGIYELYKHQRMAVDAVQRGEDVVVVTPTASGKSLCYNLPVLQAVMERPEARAFYLFPTKALAQDQVGSLQALIDELDVPVRTFTYDGDTPADARTAVRTRGHVIVSNPDMLHAGILPNHPRWRKVLQDLEFIVLDEIHTYRGIFGSHVANVIRRLLRLCEFYGSRPRFICCSATIANPEEHAQRLLGRPVTVIGPEHNGAPAGPKEVLLYNPPVINEELGIRKGVMSQALRIATPFIEQDVPTICFTGSRLHTEVLSRYLRERFCRRPGTGHKIASYRGGYLPGLRRQVERGLRDGDVVCVVSTNALELGIDIGQLDVAILAGYPGSVASMWQQGGRAGRGLRRSVVVMIARNSPLDQFVVTHPEWLMGSAPEHARIDPDNLMVLVAHIKCSLYELPFRDGDDFGAEPLDEILEFLEEAGVAHHRDSTWHWSEESYPADGVSLRSADPENVVIIDTSAGSKVIAETDRLGAQTVVHEGAIYMVESQPYQVDKLDWPQCKAYVRRVDVDHFTTAMSYSKVRIIDTFEEAPWREAGTRAHGEVHVARKTVGYKKVKLYTSENCGYGDVHLPDVELHTTSWWLSLSGEHLAEAGYRGLDVVDGMLGLGRVLKGLAALHLMCDSSDLGVSLADPEDEWVAALDRGGRRVLQPTGKREAIEGDNLKLLRPTLFLYDNIPGGVGFSEKLFEIGEVLIEEARGLIVECPCQSGCPRCVGPLGEVEDCAKAVAMDLCDWLSGRIERPRGPDLAIEIMSRGPTRIAEEPVSAASP